MSALYDTREAERARIDEEIKSLRQQILHLRTRRNTLAPVYCLPLEILTAIFRQCRDAAAAQGHACQWIAETTHICRYWRSVALSSGELWALPDLLHPQLSKEMMLRAGSSPLCIVVGDSRDEDLVQTTRKIHNWKPIVDALVDAFTTHSDKIHIIDLHFNDARVLQSLMHIKRPPPLLDTLILKSSLDNAIQSLLQLTVPSNLYGGGVLRLRTLHLHGVSTTQWGNLSPEHLTSLTIKHTTPPSFTTLLGILRGAPMLQVLVIYSHPVYMSAPPPDVGSALIHLRHIRTIRLYERAVACEALLSRLMCSISFAGPVDSRDYEGISIDCADYNDTSIATEQSVLRIASWMARTLGSSVVRLDVSNNFIALSGTVDPIRRELLSPVRLVVGNPSRGVLLKCLSALPLHSLRVLDVDFHRAPVLESPQDWHACLGCARDMCSLTVNTLYFDAPLKALETNPAGYDPIFPRLRELTVLCAIDIDVQRCISALSSRLDGEKGMVEFIGCEWSANVGKDVIVPDNARLTVIYNGRVLAK